MDLRQLETLTAIAQHGSFTRAANAVHLTQSAISQQMKELENELNIVLFDRAKRPPVLTHDGDRLVETAQKILLARRDFLNSSASGKVSGGLVVGACRSALISALPKALIDLKKNQPSLSLKLVNSGRLSVGLIDDVCEAKIDAGLIVNTCELPEWLNWRPYATEKFYVIAGKNTPGETDAELLNSGSYLRFVPNLPIEENIDKELKKRRLLLKPEMELDTFESILLMVSHGLGVGIVPQSYITPETVKNIRYLPFGNPPLTRELGIVSSPDGDKKNLIDVLLKSLNEQTLLRQESDFMMLSLEAD